MKTISALLLFCTGCIGTANAETEPYRAVKLETATCAVRDDGRAWALFTIDKPRSRALIAYNIERDVNPPAGQGFNTHATSVRINGDKVAALCASDGEQIELWGLP
jgi:hypothetical protein